MHAFVELHIEQGIVLESAGRADRRRHRDRRGPTICVFAGRRGPRRCDADGRCAATRWRARPRRWWSGEARGRRALGTTVATVGVMRVRPGAINVVPGEVEFDVDVRDSDAEARQAVVDGILAASA